MSDSFPPMERYEQISLDRIVPDPDNVRRAAPTEAARLGLQKSIAMLGLIHPIVVRPIPDGRYQIVVGHQRYAAVRALAWPEIPCMVRRAADASGETPAVVIQTAENMVRVAMSPVDTWRAVAAMVERGAKVDAAALALGLDPRMVRRLQVLGSIAEPVLEAIASLPPDQFPDQETLKIIAGAPVVAQRDGWLASDMNWSVAERLEGLAGVLHRTKIPQSRALFKTDLMAWDQDFFAEVGSDDEFTTTDKVTFFKHQRVALEDKVKRDGRRWSCAVKTATSPTGPTAWLPDGTRPKKGAGATEFWFIHESRWQIGQVDRVLIRTKAPETATADGEFADAYDGDGEAGETMPQHGSAEPAAPEPVQRPFTDQGLAMIGVAREVAIKGAALDRDDPYRMIAALLATMAGRNVRIDGVKPSEDPTPATGWENRVFDLARDLVRLPDETREVWRTRVMNAASAAIIRCAIAPSPRVPTNSGPAFDLIGIALEAEQFLPRFDEPSILEQCKGVTLFKLCDAANIKHGTNTQMREWLSGRAASWVPDEAKFEANRSDAGAV